MKEEGGPVHKSRDGTPEQYSAPQSSFVSGTKIGGYEIEDLLGLGGMGEVYRARDLRLGRDVAIKIVRSAGFSEPDWLRRFEQEAQAAAALDHPNILAVFQFGEHGGAPYLVSELLQGETLRELLKKGALPTRRALDLAVQAASGLSAAHDKGILHRDLKPENLFVTKHGRVKILDFGLAKFTGRTAEAATTPAEITQPGTLLGTVGYMSPEQLRGQTADRRSDLFAVGVILHEMLTGKQPFQKPSLSDTINAILNEDPPQLSESLPNLPSGLQRIVHRCLEKNPEQRFQSASDLAFALETISDPGHSRPLHVPTLTESHQGWGGVRWHRRRWITVLIIVIVCAAAGVIWWNLTASTPHVEAISQLTNDGMPKPAGLVTDGLRIFFNEGHPGSLKIAEVSASGGETAIVSSRLQNAQIAGLTADGSALLALVGGYIGPLYPLWGPQYPLWLIPVPAGEPRRLGDLVAKDANLFPDGHIVFTKGPSLYIADKNGANSRQIFHVSRGQLYSPTASPDNTHVAFTSWPDPGSRAQELDEAEADGTKLRAIVKSNPGLVSPCWGRWSPDGKHLVFQNLSEGRWDLWTVTSKRAIFKHSPTPVRLTNGPLSYTSPTPDPGGRRIFAIGSHARGELTRYDIRSRQFTSFLSGISATDPTFSKDGKWVAYASYPDRAIWRSRIDGSEAQQLTSSPLVALLPVISPDGRKVVFTTATSELYIAEEGKTPQKLSVEARFGAWSPDGESLLLTTFVPGKRVADTRFFELQTMDLRTGKLSAIPDSQGMLGAFWLTQDTLVAANSNFTTFRVFNFRTKNWSDLITGNFVNWFVSVDGKYLYVTTGTAEPEVMRVEIGTGQLQPITSLKGLRRTVDSYSGTQVNVAPDGSPVFTRDIGTQEIYALDVRWE